MINIFKAAGLTLGGFLAIVFATLISQVTAQVYQQVFKKRVVKFLKIHHLIKKYLTK